MSNEDLRREVLAARRRRWRTALVLALCATATTIAIVLRPAERVRTVYDTHVVTVPHAIGVERVIEVPTRRDAVACPLPRTDASPGQPAQPPEKVDFVQPAITNAGWVAAWNEVHIFVSRDAGATWNRALDGPGLVRDVHFDCFGRLIAVRGKRLGVRDRGVELWKPVPDLMLKDFDQESGDEYTHIAEAVVLGGGPDIVLVGHVPQSYDELTWQARLVVSRDGGATWQRRDLTEYWERGTAHGRQNEDGSIRAILPQSDCGGDSPWEFTLANDKLEQGYADVDDDNWARLVEGPFPIIVRGDHAYRITDDDEAELPIQLHQNAFSVAVDPAGRIWSSICGRLHIATREPPKLSCD